MFHYVKARLSMSYMLPSNGYMSQGKMLISLGLIIAAALAWSGVFKGAAEAIVNMVQPGGTAGATHHLIVAVVVTLLVIFITAGMAQVPNRITYRKDSPPTPAA